METATELVDYISDLIEQEIRRIQDDVSNKEMPECGDTKFRVVNHAMGGPDGIVEDRIDLTLHLDHYVWNVTIHVDRFCAIDQLTQEERDK